VIVQCAIEHMFAEEAAPRQPVILSG